MAPAQRPGDLPGPGPPRRGGDHLREPAQRDQRRRRPVPQVRQRRPAAGLVDGAAVQPGGDRPPAGGGGQGRPARGLDPPRRGRLPRGRRRAHAADRLRRLPDPPGRAVAGAIDPRQRQGPLRHRRRRQLPRLRRRRRRPRPGPRHRVNAKTQRPSVCNAAESLLVHAAVADGFLPRAAAALQSAGVELVGDDAARRLVPGDGGGHRRRLRPGVPGPQDVGGGGARPRGGRRPRQPVRHRPHRGHRHRGHRRRPPLRRRRRRRHGHRQRLDPLHRRRGVRLRRRDRHLHPEAPRPGADGPPGAHHLQVRRVGRRPDPGVSIFTQRNHRSAPSKGGTTSMAERFESVDAVQDALRRVDYLADASTAGVVFLADRLEKPVLVEGPAGVGKTELAKAHRRHHRLPADPAPVLRGPRREQGPLRVELQEAAAPDPGRPGARAGLGDGRVRHLLRAVPPHPSAAGGDPGRRAGGAAHRRGRPGRDRDRGAAPRGALRLPGVGAGAGHHDRRCGGRSSC